MKEAIRFFVKKYNSALHFWNFSKHNIYTKRPFDMPPRCLERGMLSTADLIKRSHEMWVSPDPDINENTLPNTNRVISDDFREWREAGMDFDGLEIDNF